MEKIKVRITFTEEVLGTASANPELYKEFIMSKRPDGPSPDEAAALPPIDDEIQKAMTVFSRVDGKDSDPIFWDYQIKGFFKDACSVLSRVAGDKEDKSGSLSSKLKAYKKVIDGTVFVHPRAIAIKIPDGKAMGTCERPLRAQTAQGERVALAKSETVPAGSSIEVVITLLDGKLKPTLMEWLEYGELRGLGQWRNSGKGRFTFEVLK